MTGYELSRRDAIAALGSVGIAAGGLLTWEYLNGDAHPEEPTITERDRELLYALAEVVYPSEVSGVPEFVETYVVGRATDDPDRLDGIAESLAYVDNYAEEWYDTPFLDLSPDRRETALEAMGADVADPDPEGSDVERVRFYLVNELLYALYTSPTGGELLGLENPQGYPGGTDSYRRGPPG